MKRWARGELGQSMVEFGLALPILVFGLIGGGDLARAFAVQLAVQNGARAGAEAYAINSAPTAPLAQSAAVNEINRTPAATATAANVTVTVKQGDGLTNCTTPPTVATPCFVTVRVQYTFNTTIPWPMIPNTFNFDRSTSMRTFY